MFSIFYRNVVNIVYLKIKKKFFLEINSKFTEKFLDFYFLLNLAEHKPNAESSLSMVFRSLALD